MSQQVDEMQGVGSKIGVDNPFPGLRPFKIDESHLFFGREGQSDEVLLKLSKNRFVGVIGPSGSGKSSFIYCGVLPILYGGFLTDASPNWEVVVSRPGANPIDNLAESLLGVTADYDAAGNEDKKIKRTIVSTLLRSSSLGLVEAIQQSRRKEDVNYLILIDQFEELFRFKDSTDPNSINETLAFVNLLMEAVNYPDSPIYVAITMRSDFIGDCAQFPDLTRKINDSHYLIPQMTRDQKRRAIEGPVAVGGAHIAPRLVQQLLNDLGDNPDQLPILQHSLMRTWSYWAKYKDYDDEPLDLKHYEAIGTMSEALSMHANEAYDELDEHQKRICEVLFKAITEKRGENFGIRRPTRLNEIAAIADVAEEDLMGVLDKFREPGRSLLTPAFTLDLHSKSMVDISHESLMRIWVRLKNWVDDEADAVQMYHRLAEAASMYQVGKAGLWRPPDLQLALNWQAKHKPTIVWGQRYHPAFERTMVFLEYSKKEFETEQRIKELEQKRKLQRARITAAVMGFFTIVALMGLVFAVYQRTLAVEQQKRAEESEAAATVAKNDAIAQKEEAEKQRLAAEEARAEADKQRLIALDNERAANEAKALAEEQKILADKSALEAKRQEGIAKANEKTAKDNEVAARKAEADAKREKMLSVAKAMALTSQTLGSNPDLEALVAQQAHNFHTAYNGYPYDNDIYNGLFAALVAKNHPLTHSLQGHNPTGAVRALETRVSTNHIYSGGTDGKILLWELKGTDWVFTEIVPERTGYVVYSLDINPNEDKLAVGGLYTIDSKNNYVELYDLHNHNAPPKKISGYKDAIGDIRFTPDGKGFYARDNGGLSIKYSDMNTVREVVKPKVKIMSLDLNVSGTKLVGAGFDGTVYIWDIYNDYSETKVELGKSSIQSVAFAPEGRRVVSGDADGQIKIIDVGVGAPRELAGHTSAIEHIRFNHSGSFMATSSKDGSIRLWNFNELTSPPIVLSDHDWVWSVAFTPNDEQLFAGINSQKEEIVRGAQKTNFTIHAWPTRIETMAGILCGESKRNMSQEEWEYYVGKNIDREKTCKNLPENN